LAISDPASLMKSHFIMSRIYWLLTAFSLGAAAPNRQSGCDNRGPQRAFPPTLSIPEEAL
jgi:hypothetical protein